MAPRSLFCQVLFAALTVVSALPFEKRNTYKLITNNSYGDTIFGLGNTTYLANTQHPKATLSGLSATTPVDGLVPITAITTNETVITGSLLQTVVSSYAEADDVFTEDFLEAFYISASGNATLDKSALSYLSSINTSYLFLSESFSSSSSSITGSFTTNIVSHAAGAAQGPFAASIGTYGVSLLYVYKLYRDVQQTFLHGAYSANDGNGAYNPLGFLSPKWPDPMIPVPSRVYSWNDDRPLAGQRVAIKDLYDVKGLQTSGGSRAWARITPIANGTAPAVQRIIDLGGIIVGKQKLAQFASGANPWDWQDEQYPFNPRGDGWLTCSASSSGGACSVAAYDWLDNAIGSDTGSSMRRPAAVTGLYGQRPSQGMISLERVLPLGGATDTAGVFSRDPYQWIKFAKSWYSPSLHQSSEITGLSTLAVPDSYAFPKRILYPIDYLPLNNSAAEPILEEFIDNLSRIFNMTVEKFNFTATVQNWTDPVASNFGTLNAATGIINSWSAWTVIGKPLLTTWSALFDGRFPPIDSARRSGWRNFNETRVNADTYAQALATKNQAVEYYEKHLQYSTNESCSESIMLYDIGTGGLPSFREQELNDSPDASYLAVTPEGAAITGANICPIFGCADFTVPIGQVPYHSNVTFHEEMVPVTIGMVVKRGCDFMLYNMIEKLADEGVLKAVKTGRTAF